MSNARVRILVLRSTVGMMVNREYLVARRAGAEGTLGSYVGGHGGDVWWVKHDDGSVGAYATDEFETIPCEPTPPPPVLVTVSVDLTQAEARILLGSLTDRLYAIGRLLSRRKNKEDKRGKALQAEQEVLGLLMKKV